MRSSSDAAAGRQARDTGMSDVLAADTAAHRMYGELCKAAIADLIAGGVPFTAESVRDTVTARHPGAAPHHPNVLPAIIGSMSAAGLIVPVGDVQATRKTRHGGRNRVWKGADNA